MWPFTEPHPLGGFCNPPLDFCPCSSSGGDRETRPMLSDARSSGELVAEPGIEPISPVPAQHSLLPGPCGGQGDGSRAGGRRGRALPLLPKLENAPGNWLPAYTPSLWAPGTGWPCPVQKRVPTTLSSLGCSERLRGARGAGGSGQGLSCVRLGVQLANAAAACPKQNTPHVLNPGPCHVLSSAQRLLLLLLEGSNPSAAAWSSPLASQGAPLSRGAQHPLTLPVLSLCTRRSEDTQQLRAGGGGGASVLG